MGTKRTVRVRVELEIDTEAYDLTYGVGAEDLEQDVVDYLVELLGYCSAANEGCWVPKVVKALAR